MFLTFLAAAMKAHAMVLPQISPSANHLFMNLPTSTLIDGLHMNNAITPVSPQHRSLEIEFELAQFIETQA